MNDRQWFVRVLLLFLFLAITALVLVGCSTNGGYYNGGGGGVVVIHNHTVIHTHTHTVCSRIGRRTSCRSVSY